MIDQLQRQDFTDLPPGGLVIEHEGATIPVTVVDSRVLPSPSPRVAPFAIELAGPATPMLPQAIYPVVHPQHGRLELFVVPIARDAEHVRYEVIFN
jgi:hypothetical protein